MRLSTPSRTGFILLPVVLLIALLGSLLTGSARIPPLEVVNALVKPDSDSVWATIITGFRLPKALACTVSGAALALGGLLMQTLFRNPLAGPDVMGLSSGASLAVGLVTLTGAGFASPWLMAISASIGSGLVFLLMLTLAFRVRDNSGLLILGLMVGALTSSLVWVLQYVSRSEDLQFFIYWTMGRVGGLSLNEIAIIAGCLTISTLISAIQVKALNTWLLGNRYAESLGVHLNRSRGLLLLATSLLVGSVTAFCGPIAFVGIAVPHLVRPLVGRHHHAVLIPGVMMAGASLLLICDMLCQWPGTSLSLPLNAVTSIVGAPVVIIVILKMKKLSA